MEDMWNKELLIEPGLRVGVRDPCFASCAADMETGVHQWQRCELKA